jgi:hypothetical protein
MNHSTKRIRVSLYANSSEANSRVPNNSRHLTGGIHYSVQISPSVPDDHDSLLEMVRQMAPSQEMVAQRLFSEFAQYEPKLLAWIERSRSNAERFARDPFGALNSANLGISKQTLTELMSLSSALAGSMKGGA